MVSEAKDKNVKKGIYPVVPGEEYFNGVLADSY